MLMVIFIYNHTVVGQSEVENRTMETNTTEDVRTDCIESGWCEGFICINL